ncbi:MAG: Gfo/Idh/MocA family oxidoreductase [Oscillospiraceae bacterium]|nr:Gfo/Idh/MocA family oxidoreductase [Oscillospiraceae bacterium]
MDIIMGKKLKVGIVGCGGIANAKHMPSISKIDEAEIVAFCDIIPERAQKAAKDFGTADAKTYEDYKELVKDGSIDVVHVLTPNKSHSVITIAALDAGKHVMCEKPMAKTYAEAKAMLDASKRNGKILSIGYQYRYEKHKWQLQKMCRAGELGDIYHAKAHALRRRAVPTWGVFLNEEEQGGGPLIDIGTHALDMTLWMMDNYKPVYAVGNTYFELAKTENAANAWGPWDTKKYTVEDGAFGFVMMENGATISLEATWAVNMRNAKEAICTLCGTKAGADLWDGLIINGEEGGFLYEKKINTDIGGVAFYEGNSGGKPAEIEAMIFYNAILKGTELVVKPEQAMVVTQILEGIYESAKTKKPVFF